MQIRPIALVAGMALAACTHTGQSSLTPEQKAVQEAAVQALTADKPSELAHLYRDVVVQGERNAVLNWLRVGKSALNFGRTDLAAEAFDKALAGIEAVYADNPQAEKARSVWYAESVKDFKGEPYERAMAYYYRGLIYLSQGDYENARASFKGALLQDGFAENERHRQDFAVAAWLSGWSSHCLGDRSQAEESFREAAEIRNALPPPALADRLLVVLEAGEGPVKEAYGQNREKLAYRERLGPTADYAVRLGKTDRPLRRAEDLFFQATTRGGRQMDKILAIKSDTKVTTAAVGAGAVVAGYGMMTTGHYTNDRNAAAAGAIVALAGLIAHAAAQGMTAEADTRYWNDLPHSIFLASLPATKGLSPENVEVTFQGGGVTAISNRERVRFWTTNSCSMAWIPETAVRISPPAPPVVAAPVAAQPPSAASQGTKPETSAPPFQESGNCRTAAGTLVNLEPDRCRGINGTVLSTLPAKS